jgi:RNA polymerase sigma factor for flagellar operon FliA
MSAEGAEVVPLVRRLTAQQQADIVLARAMVRRVAAQLARTKAWLLAASGVSQAELVQLGDVELAGAMTKYKPGPVTFEAYAHKAVLGAMMNRLKAESAYQRVVREGADKANGSWEDEPGGRSASGEAAPAAYCDGAVTGMLLALAGADPEHVAMTRELHEAVRAAVAEEPARERRLVERHYFEGETLEQAGRALGMSRSTAKRKHGAALERIGGRLRRRGVG